MPRKEPLSFQSAVISLDDQKAGLSIEKPLEQIRLDLLAWAGLHRGRDISENAMPRFHEIIESLDVLIDITKKE